MTFDEIREQQPQLGLALYAIEAGGPVTFEVHTPDGQVFTWRGATEAQVLALAFPPAAPAEIEPEPPVDVFD
jgi:hypothetical protein